MKKIAVGPECRGVVDLKAPVADNLKRIAHAKGMDVRDLTAVILDRPRHEELIEHVRQAGARIRLIPACDVTAALMTAYEDSGIDVLVGIGGSPEGVLAACALRAMGGEIQGQLMPRNDRERTWTIERGIEPNSTLAMEDLVASEDVFFAATGISDGELLGGVEYFRDFARTDSLVVRGATGTVRRIRATHRLDKIRRLGKIDY
jgi:fructose-1,6-bisphosphatase II